MTAAAATPAPEQKGALARLLDFIEVAGNKVPHPVLMFLYLIIGVIVLSTVLAFFNLLTICRLPGTHRPPIPVPSSGSSISSSRRLSATSTTRPMRPCY